MRDNLNGILSKHTGQEIDKIANDTDRDYFMSAVESRDYGLVDEVIDNSKPEKKKSGITDIEK